jgi:hypothetical protein
VSACAAYCVVELLGGGIEEEAAEEAADIHIHRGGSGASVSGAGPGAGVGRMGLGTAAASGAASSSGAGSGAGGAKGVLPPRGCPRVVSKLLPALFQLLEREVGLSLPGDVTLVTWTSWLHGLVGYWLSSNGCFFAE